MARGKKCRKICVKPENCLFTPELDSMETVTLSFEELEAVRMTDLAGMDQDQSARMMEVSRATLQRILYSARKKIADALIGGKRIEIKGGSYELTERSCGCGQHCTGCRFARQQMQQGCDASLAGAEALGAEQTAQGKERCNENE